MRNPSERHTEGMSDQQRGADLRNFSTSLPVGTRVFMVVDRAKQL